TIEDLENLLDNIPYIIWIKDEEGRYKYANKLATEKLDLEQKNLLGKKNSDFKDNEILKNWPDNERKILEEKSCAYFKRKIKSDGEDICVETYNMPFLSSKKTNLIGGVVRKITTEKKVVSHIKDASINICNKNKYDELKNK
ncbi:PAS domain S-box protein, partial [Clostridium sp. ZBS2]